jgi:hypothetical protein
LDDLAVKLIRSALFMSHERSSGLAGEKIANKARGFPLNSSPFNTKTDETVMQLVALVEHSY